MGRKRRLPVFEQIPILDIGAQGKSIAKINGEVVFVTGALPGDVVDLKITRKKKSYMEGIPLNFHQYSEKRVQPFCKHFDICGGCKWQDLPYAEQLKYKKKQVVDNLERIAKVELPAINEILPSQYTRYYRNKMEFTFSGFRWLTREEIDTPVEYKDLRGVGLHVPGRWDKIVDIEHCYLQKEPSNSIRLAIRDFAKKQGYSFFDLKKQQGLLRNLIIRTTTTDEVMVIVVFGMDDPAAREEILDHVVKQFPEITSLYFMINCKGNDSIFDLVPVLYHGNDCIYEKMEDLQFRIGPKSFYQTNSYQAHELYRLIKQFADVKEDEVLYDLYTGTGTIANYLARHCKKTVGIDSVPEAIEDAGRNAELNELDNTSFVSGDIKDLFNENFFGQHGYPQVIVTDPPRAGMHKNVVSGILKANPRRIVYVSCNPATQARDIELLTSKYKVIEVQPVDMFPHTYHIENVVKMDRK